MSQSRPIDKRDLKLIIADVSQKDGCYGDSWDKLVKECDKDDGKIKKFRGYCNLNVINQRWTSLSVPNNVVNSIFIIIYG